MAHILRYLLIYGERKKKVEVLVNQDVESAQVQILRERASELFNLPGVILQIWDKGFEDWVDLDDGDAMPTNSRIKVEVDKSATSFPSKSPPATHPPSQCKEDVRPQVAATHKQQALHSVVGVASFPPPVPPQVTHSATASAVSSAAMLSPAMQTVSSHLLTQAPSVLISPQNLFGHSGPAHGNMHSLHDARQSALSKIINAQNVAFQNPYQMQITPPVVKRPKTSLPSSSTSVAPSSTQKEPQVVATSSLDRLSKISSNFPSSHQDGQNEGRVSSLIGDNQNDELEDLRTLSQIGRVEDPQWIFNFQLPELPKQITAKLDSRVNIDNMERTLLLNRLYETVTKHTFYPTASDYSVLTDKLLERFPQLYSLPGPMRSDHTPWEAWKSRIMHKFKNQRKRKDRDIPVVQMRKRSQIPAARELMDGYYHDTQFQDISYIAGDPDGATTVDEIEEVIIKDENKEEDSPGYDEYHVMVADTTELPEVS